MRVTRIGFESSDMRYRIRSWDWMRAIAMGLLRILLWSALLLAGAIIFAYALKIYFTIKGF